MGARTPAGAHQRVEAPMPWRMNRNDDIVCTGGCNPYGCIPCVVDHAAQPFNDVDTDDGSEFYRCPECEWIIPDPTGENKYEGAGTVPCPECEQGERWQTFVGPCDFCSSKKRTATSHEVPEELQPAAKAKRFFSSTRWHCCPQCFYEKTTELAQLQAELDAAEAERLAAEAAKEAEVAWYRTRRKTHQDAGRPPGTCEGCGQIDFLAISGGPTDEFLCVNCAPRYEDPIGAEPAGDLPPHGWYPDPEEDGYLRWWSGSEWAGPPVLPEHVITQ